MYRWFIFALLFCEKPNQTKSYIPNISSSQFKVISVLKPCFIVVVFPQAPFRATNVPEQASASPTAQLHHSSLRKAIGDFFYSICIGEVVWLFMFCWTCRFILGHVPCKFWKVCLGLSIFHRSIMEETDLLGCSPRQFFILNLTRENWKNINCGSHLQFAC